jgi:hypothetical protein
MKKVILASAVIILLAFIVYFGRLVEGIRSMPNYRDAILVLYSDHGHLTHRFKETIQDIFMRSAFGRYDRDTDTNLVDVLARAGVIQGSELDYRGFCPITGSSAGAIFFRGRIWATAWKKPDSPRRLCYGIG